jgi:hypothetical protein
MNNKDNLPRNNDSIPSKRISDAGLGHFSFEVINNIDDVDQLPAADPLDLAQDPQVQAVIADPQLAAPPVANPQAVAIGGQAAAVQANPLSAVPPVANPQAQVVQFAGVPQVPGVQPHVDLLQTLLLNSATFLHHLKLLEIILQHQFIMVLHRSSP